MRDLTESFVGRFTDRNLSDWLTRQELQQVLVVLFLHAVEPDVNKVPMLELAARDDEVKNSLSEAFERCRAKSIALDVGRVENTKAKPLSLCGNFLDSVLKGVVKGSICVFAFVWFVRNYPELLMAH